MCVCYRLCKFDRFAKKGCGEAATLLFFRGPWLEGLRFRWWCCQAEWRSTRNDVALGRTAGFSQKAAKMEMLAKFYSNTALASQLGKNVNSSVLILLGLLSSVRAARIERATGSSPATKAIVPTKLSCDTTLPATAAHEANIQAGSDQISP